MVPVGILFHTNTINPPAITIDFSVHKDKTQCAIIATEWVGFIAKLQGHLEASTIMLEEDKVPYRLSYKAELNKFMTIINSVTGSTSTSGAGTSSAAAATTTTVATSSGVKAKSPEKYNGSHEQLELFLDNMIAYFDVMSIPDDKKASVLRLNLSNNVIKTLSQTHSYVPDLWGSYHLIVSALKEIYTQPNKKAVAQTKLKTLKMFGYKLTKYFDQFITLCGQAHYNVDDQPQKNSFYEGLNNSATRGGLRSQVMQLVHDDTKKLKDIYVLADNILQADIGPSYNTMSCPTEKDEHNQQRARGGGTAQLKSAQEHITTDTRDTGFQNQGRNRNNNNNNNTQQQNGNGGRGGRHGGRNNGGRNGERGGNGRGGRGGGRFNPKKDKFPKYKFDESKTCQRCTLVGHDESTCNARWHGQTGEELPIATAANKRNGLWKQDYYPTKKANTTNNHIPLYSRQQQQDNNDTTAEDADSLEELEDMEEDISHIPVLNTQLHQVNQHLTVPNSSNSIQFGISSAANTIKTTKQTTKDCNQQDKEEPVGTCSGIKAGSAGYVDALKQKLQKTGEFSIK